MTCSIMERIHRHGRRRVKTGPTSRKKSWTIIADTCECGLVRPIKRPLTHEQKSWVRRINQRAHRPK